MYQFVKDFIVWIKSEALIWIKIFSLRKIDPLFIVDQFIPYFLTSAVHENSNISFGNESIVIMIFQFKQFPHLVYSKLLFEIYVFPLKYFLLLLSKWFVVSDLPELVQGYPFPAMTFGRFLFIWTWIWINGADVLDDPSAVRLVRWPLNLERWIHERYLLWMVELHHE